jgi:hypothetical protein
MRTLWARFLEFVFPLSSDSWLTVLRVGLGLQIASYCLSLRADWNSIFSENGLISRDLAEAILDVESALTPRFGWLFAAANNLGLSEPRALLLVWILLLCASCGLVLGLYTRTFSVMAWLLHLCAVKSGSLFAYGADNFTTIGLFYLMVAPLPDRFSLDYLWRKIPAKELQRQGFHRRVLQLHLCLIYFFGGLAKCIGGGWWDGTSIWRALTRTPFNVISPEAVVHWRSLFPILAISVWIIELGYPFFIWSKKLRPLWLVCVIGVHLGIGLAMGLYLFSSVMIVLNLSAFAPDWLVDKATNILSRIGRQKEVTVAAITEE